MRKVEYYTYPKKGTKRCAECGFFFHPVDKKWYKKTGCCPNCNPDGQRRCLKCGNWFWPTDGQLKASRLGIRPTYCPTCSKERRNFKHPGLLFGRIPTEEIYGEAICQNCGKIFQKRSAGQKYCLPTCQGRGAAGLGPLHKKVCRECGTVFETGLKTQVFCSPEHQYLWWVKKKGSYRYLRNRRRRCKNPECDILFWPRHKNHWYCSPECGARVYRYKDGKTCPRCGKPITNNAELCISCKNKEQNANLRKRKKAHEELHELLQEWQRRNHEKTQEVEAKTRRKRLLGFLG